MLAYVAKVFMDGGYAGRLVVWARVEEAEKEELILATGVDAFSQPPGVESLEFQREFHVDQLMADPELATRDAMDTIWQGFGLPRCLLFDADGNW